MTRKTILIAVAVGFAAGLAGAAVGAGAPAGLDSPWVDLTHRAR